MIDALRNIEKLFCSIHLRGNHKYYLPGIFLDELDENLVSKITGCPGEI